MIVVTCTSSWRRRNQARSSLRTRASSAPNGSTQEAMVERVVHLGFEVRVDLVLAEGDDLSVQVTRDAAEQLELERGHIVYVRPSRETVFTP